MKFRHVLLAALVAFSTLFTGSSLAIPESPSPSSPTIVSGGRFYSNGTADALIKTGRGLLVGIFVASSTSCTIKLWDNTSAATTVLVNTFSASAATWYPLPFVFNTGLYLDVSGTCDVTVSYT